MEQERPLRQPAGPPPGRLLGLDAGDRRIGVAVSDPDQRLAVSLPTIEKNRPGEETERIRQLVREDEVVAVVIGLPLSLSGEKGPQAEKVEAFAHDLARDLSLPVFLWDERLTTREAEQAAQPRKGGREPRGRRSRPDTDAIAATIILQAFLDSLRRWESDSER